MEIEKATKVKDEKRISIFGRAYEALLVARDGAVRRKVGARVGELRQIGVGGFPRG
jgi:hypothetical protein